MDFDKVKHLNYVVMRNWRDLPELDPVHPDIDFFVSDEDLEEFNALTPEWVDVRSPSDKYFPEYISNIMLVDKIPYKDFFIPNPPAYFLSLYYHAVIHKEENKYHDELKWAFLNWIPPVRAKDEGVGYFV